MKYILEFTMDEIADDLGVSLATACRYLEKSLLAIREELASSEPRAIR